MLQGHQAPITFIDFHPKLPAALLSSSLDGTCRIWDASSSHPAVHILQAHPNFNPLPSHPALGPRPARAAHASASLRPGALENGAPASEASAGANRAAAGSRTHHEMSHPGLSQHAEGPALRSRDEAGPSHPDIVPEVSLQQVSSMVSHADAAGRDMLHGPRDWRLSKIGRHCHHHEHLAGLELAAMCSHEDRLYMGRDIAPQQCDLLRFAWRSCFV